ncbi:hypothetical protein RI129_010254 [Pyrocoelia pectoralis]|uniref:Pre-C2HC domain-containing protein n=1 Tax=Pyrocoelia pectoralis TaxID=417401 RepID=A0AAN7ZGW7_9COLE
MKENGPQIENPVVADRIVVADNPIRLFNINNEQSNNKHQYYRLTSTSDDETEENPDEDANPNPWQRVKQTKRRKVSISNSQNITLQNKYSQLTEAMEEETNITQVESKVPRPPPIFLIHFMQENKIVHHTYQPKEERAYRVVIKHLHYTTITESIKEELSKGGHQVRNITNARKRITKEPLNLFFVDLEPAESNKNVYKIQKIQNQIVTIEPPKITKGISQCMRCQQYGHTKAYCTRPYVCVKCGGTHSTNNCTKTRDTPARCALCNGPHPASYKGCEFYQGLLKKSNNVNNRLNIQHNPLAANFTENQSHTKRIQQNISFAEAVKNNKTNEQNALHSTESREQNEHPTETPGISLNKFLDEFKAMFQQLVQQNTMVMNLLTTLISKIH